MPPVQYKFNANFILELSETLWPVFHTWSPSFYCRQFWRPQHNLAHEAMVTNIGFPCNLIKGYVTISLYSKIKLAFFFT